jgi:hypothetical protein
MCAYRICLGVCLTCARLSLSLSLSPARLLSAACVRFVEVSEEEHETMHREGWVRQLTLAGRP